MEHPAIGCSSFLRTPMVPTSSLPRYKLTHPRAWLITSAVRAHNASSGMDYLIVKVTNKQTNISCSINRLVLVLFDDVVGHMKIVI
jgi:hypothetical protein